MQYIPTLEQLEDRTVPNSTRIFPILFTGFNSPAAGSGMEKLSQFILNDPELAAAVASAPVFGWQSGASTSTQLAAARSFVDDWLEQNLATAEDAVVLIGHSYGAHIASILAADVRSDVTGAQPAKALITYEAIDWDHPTAGAKHSHAAPAGVALANILNFRQNTGFLRGYRFAGAKNITCSRTTHTLIDDDWSHGRDGKPGRSNFDDDGDGQRDEEDEIGWPGTDDRRLGTYARAVSLLEKFLVG